MLQGLRSFQRCYLTTLCGRRLRRSIKEETLAASTGRCQAASAVDSLVLALPMLQRTRCKKLELDCK